MLEVRYNGCADCLNTTKSLLRNAGLFVNRDYKVEFHKEHRTDRIYEKRPDYIKSFSGAIIYNPKTESWIDIYNDDKTHCVACDMGSEKLSKLIHDLSTM